MASTQPPKRGVAYTTYVSLVSQADTKLFKTSATLATGDVTVSKDGGSFSNIGTLPVEISTTGVLAVALTSTEMTADTVVVRFRDAAGAEWADLLLTIHTVASNFDDLATAAALDTVDDFLDTEVAAIKAKTDLIPTDPADASDIAALIDALPTAAEVWSATTRTLTSTAAEVTAAVSGSDLSIVRGVTFSATITGLTIPATWSKVYFTVKKALSDADSTALVQVVEFSSGSGDGLLYLNGAAGTAAQASLTVTQASGTVAIVITDNATAELPDQRKYRYDLKALLADGSSQLLTSGDANISFTPTEAIT